MSASTNVALLFFLVYIDVYWCILIDQPLCLGSVIAMRSVLIKYARIYLDNYEGIPAFAQKSRFCYWWWHFKIILSVDFFYFWKPSGTGIFSLVLSVCINHGACKPILYPFNWASSLQAPALEPLLICINNGCNLERHYYQYILYDNITEFTF